MKPKLRFGALLSALGSLGGLVATIATHPDVVAQLPSKVALGVAIIGSLSQVFTQPVVRKDSER